MQLDRADDKSRPNLLQEEEVVPHHPLQNVWEEQILVIILQPVSQVKVAGIGDAGGRKEDWCWQD